MGKKHDTRRAPTSAVPWNKSQAWRKIASVSARTNLARFSAKPRCNAMAKRTGERCRQPALANSKCRWHGGTTGKGANWHRVQFSDGTTPSGTSKLDRKLFDIERAEKRRARHLAKMTPDQRAAYERWQQAHHPSASVRLSRRQAKAQALEAKAFLEREVPATPEILRIGEMIRLLTLQAEALANAVASATPRDDEKESIFS